MPHLTRRNFLASLASSSVLLLGGAPPALAAPSQALSDASSGALTSKGCCQPASLAAGLVGEHSAQEGGTLLSDERVKALQQAFEQTVPGLPSPGAHAACYTGDQQWVAFAGKVANDSLQTPHLDTHTRIGSVTKTMVGTLILQLMDEGKVTPQDQVGRWFPQMPDGDRITIDMLGTMASGIASYTLNDQWVDTYFAQPEKPWQPEQLVEVALALPRVFAPGDGFQYCNTNFVMLGLIAEKVADKPLAQLLEERLFRPLGMSHSSYPADNQLPQPYWHGYTLQGVKEGAQPVDATFWTPTFGAGAGQAISTPRDLRLWAKELGTGSLLKPETQAYRLRPNTHSTNGNSSYCFAVGTDNGWVAHAGTLPGYNTQVAYLPALDLTVVTAVNTDTECADGTLPAVKLFNTAAALLSPEHLPQRLHG